MTATLNVNSYGLLIRDVLLERCKLITPFTSVAKFSRTTAKPTQSEHIPYLGVYYIGDQFSEDVDNRVGEAHFMHKVKIGFSYIVQNNNLELAQEKADAGYWAIMKLLHDPNWHKWPASFNMPKGQLEYMIGSIIGGDVDFAEGAVGRNNETPIYEAQITWTLAYPTRFPPTVIDDFETLHFKVSYPFPEDPDTPTRPPIIADWTVPTTTTSKPKE